ncbi:hypothetical protein E2C01_023175 [Portunus trituberculatus]|uniref:Uncharacterized protein n=1 Tax=Portunus trituberculatus TaxID=210409 RepID=A0A5B7EAG4_PORTR|nr:hypothetical protein [Portunus trituberculatus]
MQTDVSLQAIREALQHQIHIDAVCVGPGVLGRQRARVTKWGQNSSARGQSRIDAWNWKCASPAALMALARPQAGAEGLALTLCLHMCSVGTAWWQTQV